MSERRVWAAKVGKVFDTRPRVAGKNIVWLDRKTAFDQLAQAIERPGSHVCLDGPTGVDKTSLAHTYIAIEQVAHVPVMVTNAMNWADFCRQLIGVRDNTENSGGGEIEGGLNNGLPTLKFKASLGAKGRPLDDLTYVDKLATTWTENDVAKKLADKDLLLVLDDMERATDEFIKRISDLCKLLTQAYTAPNAKLLLIGSGSVYVRLHRANPALDERVSHVSLGAFKNANDSRIFLTRGFERLDLRHPWNSRYSREFELRDKCRDAIWEAANGLPKSLNRLGYEISTQGRSRSGVSAHDIMQTSERIVEEHWIEYSEQFGDVLDVLEEFPLAAEILKCLYEDGITRIHRVAGVVKRIESNESLKDIATPNAIDQAFSLLTATEFIVQTGKSGELLFVKHPAAAHTLGVIMRDPKKVSHVSVPKRKRGMPIQLSFAFPLPSDTGSTNGEEPSADA